MLTIIKQCNAELKVSKKQISPLVENSAINFLVESIDHDSEYDFNQILDRIEYQGDCIDNDCIDNDWDIFVNFMNKKTVFYQSDVISKYNDSISILTECINPKEIMQNLNHTIIPNNIPLIINKLQLAHMYQQLIFYEYIYMNVNTTYAIKAWIIIENDYKQILSLLENSYIDPCTTTNDESTFNDFVQILNYYYPNVAKQNLLDTFLKIHNNWLLFPDNPDCEITDSTGLIEVTDQSIDLIKFINSHTINELKTMNFQSLSDTLCLNEKIKLHKLCHLGLLYDSNPIKINTFFDIIIKHIDFANLLTQDTDNISLYLSLDLFVRMMEDDSLVLTQISSSIGSKILSLWLKMNSPDFLMRFYKQKIPSLRNIKLSQCIQNILTKTHMTFTEMGYILAMDRLDMFKILCDKLEFKTIHQSIYKYLSPSIIEYVINKNTMVNDENENQMRKVNIIINPFNLVYRSSGDVNKVFKLLDDNMIHFNIEYDSLINTHHFDDCSYIAMYWDYLQIVQNTPHLIEHIFALFRKFTSNAEIDCIILRTLIDNISDKLMSSDLKNNYSTVVDKYLEPFYQKPEFFITGPDFCEIQCELTRYGINKHDLVDELSLRTQRTDHQKNDNLSDSYDPYEYGGPNEFDDLNKYDEPNASDSNDSDSIDLDSNEYVDTDFVNTNIECENESQHAESQSTVSQNSVSHHDETY